MSKRCKTQINFRIYFSLTYAKSRDIQTFLALGHNGRPSANLLNIIYESRFLNTIYKTKKLPIES